MFSVECPLKDVPLIRFGGTPRLNNVSPGHELKMLSGLSGVGAGTRGGGGQREEGQGLEVGGWAGRGGGEREEGRRAHKGGTVGGGAGKGGGGEGEQGEARERGNEREKGTRGGEREKLGGKVTWRFGEGWGNGEGGRGGVGEGRGKGDVRGGRGKKEKTIPLGPPAGSSKRSTWSTRVAHHGDPTPP